MGKMFQTVTTSWNPFTGCEFQCQYCWARKLAEGKLSHIDRYKGGFHPAFHLKELSRRFKRGQFVGISLMGDISFASREVVINILDAIRENPQTTFLFCTKNPAVYCQWGVIYPDNLYLGATIETNYEFCVTKAPAPVERYREMMSLNHPLKFISIEPLMDFHLRTLVDWMKDIAPMIIEVGADNYHNDLYEPSGAASTFEAPWKVRWLVEMLKKICPTVVEKKGLERLTKGGD